MIILGIDPGLATVGFGVIEVNKGITKALDYGVITTEKTLSMPHRLLKVELGIKQLINKYQPNEIAIEELFFNNNVKTAIMVAEARGVILTACIKECENLFEYTPLQIKQALTGYGRAEKIQVQHMVKTLLKLDKIPRPDDSADALAVALTHSQTNRMRFSFNIK